ncbi:hypothetical protein ACFLSZ_03810 [Candidatus Bipolaricaulota bacterium]
MSRAKILVFVLIVIIVGAFLLFRRSTPVQESHLTAEGVVLSGHRDDGSPAWSVRAETGSLKEDDGVLETVELTFFEGSDTDIIVRGDRLSRDSSGSTLSGSIHIEQGSVMRLETETIFWDERNDVLESGPVTIEMEWASIQAGAFHHDLSADLTTLTRGVEAQLTRDDKEYIVRSDLAEATSNQLSLLGNVSIQGEDDDEFRCQQLESDDSGSTIRLIGEVSGTWHSSAFSADVAQLDSTGIRLRNNVTIDLELLMMDEPNDA